MDILQAIKKRKSTYPSTFSDKEVSKEAIQILLEAAQCAPSHKKTYPWRFKVIRGEKKTAFGHFLSQTYEKYIPTEKYAASKQKRIVDKVHQSSAVIAICMQRDAKERVPEWEEIAATAMAVQNMWLAATAMGLGGYWSTPSLKDYFQNFLTLAPGELCLGFFYLGIEKDIPPLPRNKVCESIIWLE